MPLFTVEQKHSSQENSGEGSLLETDQQLNLQAIIGEGEFRVWGITM
jgi:hypothetical protein